MASPSHLEMLLRSNRAGLQASAARIRAEVGRAMAELVKMRRQGLPSDDSARRQVEIRLEASWFAMGVCDRTLRERELLESEVRGLRGIDSARPTDTFAWQSVGAKRVRFSGPGFDETLSGEAAVWLLRALEAAPHHRAWRLLAPKGEGRLLDQRATEAASRSVQRAIKKHPALKSFINATVGQGIWFSCEPARMS